MRIFYYNRSDCLFNNPSISCKMLFEIIIKFSDKQGTKYQFIHYIELIIDKKRTSETTKGKLNLNFNRLVLSDLMQFLQKKETVGHHYKNHPLHRIHSHHNHRNHHIHRSMEGLIYIKFLLINKSCILLNLSSLRVCFRGLTKQLRSDTIHLTTWLFHLAFYLLFVPDPRFAVLYPIDEKVVSLLT
ncbi:hypothetical protein BpHYR1_017403 [Brachionus plicatilis]|uniref:Uncharacterized protein n=1 Tax=Brachionus plicatilis TaxID=10195 RepID=A0A3M7T1X2_BRAPC|nr:hypothetical protein BpHYR1_017403 [Brachionus plicatilis]